jgi:hypothetical protein
MASLDPTTSAVLTLLNGSGTLFDQNLPARLANAQSEVSSVAANLNGAGLSNVASLLNGFDPTNIMPQLGSYIQSESPNVFINMSIYSSVSNFDNTATLSNAFSAFFTARSFVSAIDDINNTLVDPSNDGNSLSSPDPSEALENITDRVNQIVNLPTEAQQSINTQNTFFANAATSLSNYALAQQIIGTFSDFNMKAIIGSVCSDELLNILNPNSPTQPAAQPIPPPPPATGPDPTP